MVSNTTQFNVIVRTELGEGTGDEIYQTGDGKWWKPWDEVVRTGQETRQLHKERTHD